jgi:hypothetical protein
MLLTMQTYDPDHKGILFAHGRLFDKIFGNPKGAQGD